MIVKNSSDELKNGGIYKIVNHNDGKVYVGSTNNFAKRMASHKSKLNNNINKNRYLQDAWNLCNGNGFEFVIIEVINDKMKLVEREQYWIEKTKCYERNNGYNISPTAGSNTGVKLSSDVKEKMSTSALGEKNHNYGKTLPIETRVKMSEAQKKRQKEYPTKHSEETKRKIGEKSKGRVTSNKLNAEDVIEIKKLLKQGVLMQKEIAKKFNVNQRTISAISCGKTWKNVN